MSTQTQSSGGVAVICDPRSAEANAVRDFLEANGIVGAEWCAPNDVDDVDKAVRAGTIRRVVFLRLGDLLEAMWDGNIAAERWSALGANVDFVGSPGQMAAAHADLVMTSWAHWRRRHRHRQTVAGALLSAVALAIAFVLNCMPP